MYNRVVSHSFKSMYEHTYDKKDVMKNIGKNLSTALTTNSPLYTTTPKTLYQTDVCDNVEKSTYARQPSFRLELFRLPEQYNSTVSAKLDPPEPTTTYRHNFGAIGQKAVLRKYEAIKPRTLSRRTQADVTGTTRSTFYPPGYDAHIPTGWGGNRGKVPREDKSIDEFLFQYHTRKTGYAGYVPSCSSDVDLSNQKRTPTTYREMCDAVKFEPK